MTEPPAHEARSAPLPQGCAPETPVSGDARGPSTGEAGAPAGVGPAAPGPTAPPTEPLWPVPGTLVPLGIAVPVWLAAYAGAAAVFPALPALPREASVLIAACLMTALALAWIIAAAQAQAHRTVYLGMGALGLVGVLLLAGPEVTRVRTINRTASIAGTVATLGLGQLGLPSCRPLVGVTLKVRNQVYAAMSDSFAPLWPPITTQRLMLLALAQLTLATGIGLWIGRGIDEIGYLIPVALVAGLADIWSVFAGATQMIVRNAEINYFLMRFPEPGTTQLPMLIGLSDYLFAAIFYASAVKFNLAVRRTLALVFASFVIAVGLAFVCQNGFPVLPIMALLFVVGNLGRLTVSRRDVVTTVYVLIGMGLVFLLATNFLR